MGRVKLPMKLIGDKKRRDAMYRRRIKGLKKKAFELSTLCGAPVLLVSFGIDGQIHTWPEDRNEALGIANRFLQLNDEDQRRYETGLSDSLSLKIRTTEAEMTMNTTSSILGELDLQFDDISGGNIAFGREYSQPERAMDHFPEQPFNTPLSTNLGIFGDLEMQFENSFEGTFAIGENFSEPSTGRSLGQNETPLSTTSDIFGDLELQFDGNFGGPPLCPFSPMHAVEQNETPLSTTYDIFGDLELQFDGNFGGPFSNPFSPMYAVGCHSLGF